MTAEGASSQPPDSSVARWLADGTARDVAEATGDEPLLLAGYRLQEIGDYRAAIRGWFDRLRPGGTLVIVVPHAFLAERRTLLPSPWRPRQRRLYTPATLAQEIEEALVPNSYRLRFLGDDDAGYDYGAPPHVAPVGRHDVAAVIERIDPPAWPVDAQPAPRAPAPDFAFQPPRLRVEVPRTLMPARILATKLDHLGDFLMAVPALERLRAAFPAAELSLVVGSWNESLAAGTGLADRVIAFDAFPRNSSEVEVDVAGTRALFEATVGGGYDLAIDLRTDEDTRPLLRGLDAAVKAGLGTKARFPFLDIFLPVDFTRGAAEQAWVERCPPDDFRAQVYCERSPYRISVPGREVRGKLGAILYGPYRQVPPGAYVFRPFLEIDPKTPGTVTYDVAVENLQLCRGTIAGTGNTEIAFETAQGGSFEFRLWAGKKVPDLQFFGGRLAKRGAESVLHQSEYVRLLVELVAMRLTATGLLVDRASDG